MREARSFVLFTYMAKAMSSATLIKFPVVSFRRIINPYDNSDQKDPQSEDSGKSVYTAVVNIKSLPAELNEWRDINPRHSNMASGVAKKIAATLKDNPSLFFFLNRGLTVMAQHATFDNKSGNIEIELSNREMNGLLDGGHTFQVIREFIDSTAEEDLAKIDAYVRLEVITGFEDHVEAIKIVESRNTSIQVKEQSIVELNHGFDLIKVALKDRAYANRVAYKEFELTDDDSKKDIDVKELLSYLVCFNVVDFDQQSHPIIAYSGKTAIVKYFRTHSDSLTPLIPLLPKILELRDIIYRELPDAYNNDRETKGKFGLLKGVTEVTDRKMEDTRLNFVDDSSSYRIPAGFIYPILAAFRNLIEIKDGKAQWKSEPVRFFNDMKGQLAEVVGTRAKELQNPQSLGKDSSTWTLCYQAVRVAVLERGM